MVLYGIIMYIGPTAFSQKLIKSADFISSNKLIKAVIHKIQQKGRMSDAG